jgi:hypothetical protein
MAKLITSIVTIATIVGIVAALALVFSPEAHQARQLDNFYSEQYQRLQLQEAEAWQRQYEPLLQAVSATALVSVTAIAVLGAGAFVYAAGLALVHAAQSLRPEHRYRVRELEARKLVLMSDAQHRHPLPITSLHYSPHYSNRVDQQGALPGDTAHDAQPASVPSFADLITANRVGKGNPLILGFDQAAAPVVGSWLDLYSVGIGGATGSGKSWTAAYLLAQSMMHGARALVIDPHAGDSESLATRLEPLQAGMLSEPASDPRAILQTVKLLQSELEKRKTARAERTPLILVADEFTALMRGELQEPLALLIESIAQEGRKLGIYGMCLGQNWKVSRAGGGELRDSLASAFVHRIRPNQARYLTGLYADDLPADLLELPPGCAYWLSTGGELRRMTIPQCNANDLAAIGRRLTDDQPTMPRVDSHRSATDQPPISHKETVDYPASPRQIARTPEEARVIALFLDGYDAAAIVKEMHGITSKAGKPYMQKLAEVQAVVRGALQAKAVGE